jgi:serine/threonine protein kinase
VDLIPGARLGDRYHLQQRLGAGGMGEVWLAVDEVLRRSVAVKAMLPEVARDPDFARRFAAEATAMARVNHPAVASIHDYGTSHGVAFLVMEFVDGESLSQRLARDGRLTPDATMRLVADTAAGLQAVHDQGLVHRDIKPANLLLRRDGTVVITDFGIARHEDASRLTASGAILGTPSYLSPEQVKGEPAGPPSDIYALGLVAYECLAGERPFTGDNPYAVALQRLQASPRTIAVALPDRIRAVVAKSLATDPQDRWPSAAAFGAAARDAATAIPAKAKEEPPSKARADVRRQHPESARRRKILLAAAGVLLLLGGVAAWTTSRDGGKPTTGGSLAGPPAGGGPSTGSGPSTGGGSAATVPAGFSACGDAFCPVEPMCWGGPVIVSGRPNPPRPLECSEPHYWQTFQAVPAPAYEIIVEDGGDPIDKPDMAAACNADDLAARSKDPSVTESWDRSALPIPAGRIPLMHCLVGSPDGETTTDVIQS